MRSILVLTRTLTILAVIVGYASKIAAEISVNVSDNYSAISFAHKGEIQPGADVVTYLLPTPYEDRYYAEILSDRELRVVLIEIEDIVSKNPNPIFVLDKRVNGLKQVEFPPLISRRGYAAIFGSADGYSVNSSITVFRSGKRPPDTILGMKKLIEIPIQSLEKYFVLPNVNVSVEPCGTVNAYSTPDVILCTELVADLVEKELSDAIPVILMHEVGHSLLRLWDLPGFDNEDMVDEFAAAFIGTAGERYVGAYVAWLESQDSVTEALIQLASGGRHTISIQRARNMQKVIENREAALRRWDKFLAPYSRNSSPRTQ